MVVRIHLDTYFTKNSFIPDPKSIGKVSKKVRNFSHFSRVGGFEKVIF